MQLDEAQLTWDSLFKIFFLFLFKVCDNVLQKLDKVSNDDTRKLVRKFFKKIIDLKEVEQKKQLENSELQVISLI